MRRIRFVLWGLLVACCASCPDAFSRNKKGEDGPRVGYQFYNRGFSGHKLAVLVRELAKETGAGLVPFDTLFEKLIRRQPRPSYWIWDGIHPTPAGHRKMAECWLRHVRL